MSIAPEPEYRVRIQRATHPESGAEAVVIDFQTTREFTSFAYQLSVRTETSSSGEVADLYIGGLTIPPVGRPQPGPARARIYLPEPPTGVMRCRIHVKKHVSDVRVRLVEDGVVLERMDGEHSVVAVDVGSRHDQA